MDEKIILDLCGGTGAWSKPYREAGYIVDVITLPEYDVSKVEFGNHAMHFIRQDVHYHETLTVLYKEVYGILAAPPCTEFSRAKGNAVRDFDTAMQTVQACLKIIWQCRINGSLKFWALENPVGFLRQFLGIPKYQFYQWQFGGQHSKHTDIWGYFKEPTPTVKSKPAHIITGIGKRSHSCEWSTPKCPVEHIAYIKRFKTYKERRAALRAITPQGFATAFYTANR